MPHTFLEIRRMHMEAHLWLSKINEDRTVNIDLPAKLMMRIYRKHFKNK